MRRTIVLGLGLVLLTGLAAPGEPEARVELAPGTPAADIGQVHLPCEVTIQAENRSPKAIEVDLNESRVKTKSGLWQTMEDAGGENACASSAIGLAARAGATQAICTLEPACDQDRRYKFKMTYDGNIVWAYYPSANGWTQDTQLDLGDVGRHFRGY